ncbi:hypothetical protein RUMLAC_01594 [[Ruminococcus] lactaris ATCC 29176]|uniref:Uncharacterized protein n=1 Tax=[Ruminococcus] lactaris ATCC 29176 TaxID=471875 RepID=B5CQ49_9FIRM|nr:hypothetical protein RUMLAC_01594 [[Ruminococcus] lactaris ATCC 29176]
MINLKNVLRKLMNGKHIAKRWIFDETWKKQRRAILSAVKLCLFC